MASSLDLLQNQPIRFGYSPETCANNDNRAYCNLVQDGDTIHAQVRRTMGTSLGCSLLDVSATQEMVNSGFTGGAGAPWSLSGGWAYGANAVAIAAGSGHVWQAVPSLVDKAVYKVVVTTTAISLGGINIILAGSVIGSIVDSTLAGTFTFYGVADLSVNTNVGINGTTISSTVTSIELYRFAPCYTFDVDPASTFSYSEIYGISINGAVAVTASLPFEPSSTYSPHIIMDLVNYQTGTVEYGYDGTLSGAITASNGEMTYTMNSTGFAVFDTTFTDFIGTISDINFEQYSSDYFFSLNDINGVYIQSLNTSVKYCREWVTLVLDPQVEAIGYGCYRIGLYDPYLHLADIAEYSYDFTTLGAPWATSTGTTWALTGAVGETFTSTTANGTLKTSEANTSTNFGWVKLRFETGTVSGAGLATAGIDLLDATGTTLSFLNDTVVSDTIYRLADEIDPTINFSALGSLKPGLTITGATAADVYTWENATYKVYPYHQDYLSNCFTYSESVPCSKLIYAFPGENLGFNSNCSFAIVKRVRAVRIIPTYKVTSSDFIGSDGTRTLISGSGQKIYTILFDYMDELSHDVIMTLLLCKVVWIGTAIATVATNDNRYFLIPQDYTPEWDKDGKLNLAMGRIQAIQFNQVKFTTNCQ